jgi:diketogulonate reductase-like aldo/keto reductase
MTAPAPAPTLTLNNGVAMPILGLGVFPSPPAETAAAVETAIAGGYRSIDTAASYDNERGVGEAIRASGVDRGELFITTKLWFSDYGHDEAKHGITTEAWSPLGGIHLYRPSDPNAVLNALEHPTITPIAEKHGKTPARSG